MSRGVFGLPGKNKNEILHKTDCCIYTIGMCAASLCESRLAYTMYSVNSGRNGLCNAPVRRHLSIAVDLM